MQCTFSSKKNLSQKKTQPKICSQTSHTLVVSKDGQKFVCVYIRTYKLWIIIDNNWVEILNSKKTRMGNLILYFFWLSSLPLLVYGVARVFYSIWWKPKWLEWQIKQQGVAGNCYKLLVGDMKELIKLISEAWSKPIHLNHKIVQRVDPFTLKKVQKYGTLILNYNLSK